MATTLTAGLILWPRVHLVHVGDTRGYLLRRGTLRQVTTDHTVAEVLVRRGQLTPEAARRSRYQHILTSHLGGEDRDPEIQSADYILEPGDSLLIATDGLSGALAEEELAEIASRPCSSHAVCHMLVEAAHAKGTPDDATAAFVRFGMPG
jgi:PPM family protein phosphatase